MNRTLLSGSSAVAALALGIAAASQTAGASDFGGSDSVVHITCVYQGQRSTATGFVWPDPAQVVTALHSVAGCDQIVVRSEATRQQTVGTLLRVDLEGDLALVGLEKPLDAPAARLAEQVPDTRADYIIWGYPYTAEEMLDLRIEFAGGRKAGVTVLGDAFSHKDLEDLFRTRPSPRRETQILRVNTTIQPGHSGAPIFDLDGNVVAIADGGLLGGFRGINWSIPAYVYLPALLASQDRLPEGMTPHSVQFSSVAPAQLASISARPPEGSFAPGDKMLAEEFVLVRQINFSDLGTLVAEYGSTEVIDLYDQAVSYLDDPRDAETIVYNIYEDAWSGATIGIPSYFEIEWSDDFEAIVTQSPSGGVFYAASVGVADSFEEAHEGLMDVFAETALSGIEWPEDGLTVDLDEIDPEFETASFIGSIDGQYVEWGTETQAQLSLHASGETYLGVAVILDLDPEVVAPEDAFHYLSLLLGAWFLTDFAVN